MNRKLLRAMTVSALFFGLACYSNLYAWDNEVTHKDLSEYAAENSILSNSKEDYLTYLGFNNGLDEYFKWGNDKKKIRNWLREGAFLEDAGRKWDAILGKARFTNHFQNPLKSWASAGLSDMQSGESALVWAQNSAKQSVSLGRDWTWQAVRVFFYTALTKTGEADRQAYFAQTFQGLGYQMHLIQDMSQPAHVRNDAHPMDGAGWVDGLETWAKKNSGQVKTFATTTTTLVFPQVALNTNIDGYVPITQFIDANLYDGTNPSTSLTWGLSEYTNSNFLSDDTIFTENTATTDKHFFPYPRYSSASYETYLVDYSSTKKRIYIRKKADGETLEHFATTGPLRKYLSFDPELQKKELKLDNAVHQDYSEKLIPRAVGYSAALLDYFFRGTLEISAPSTHVYSITDGSVVPQRFTSIKAKVLNTTQSEAIGNGSLQAVARYKIVPNYASDLSTYPPDGTIMTGLTYSYSVSASQPISSLSSSIPAEFTFDFSGSPIPAGITDLTLQVVFKGTLGNEIETAVAVGMKDLMEPTHLVFWNLTDMFSLKKSSLGAQYELYTLARLVSEITPTTDFMRFSSLDINNNGLLADEPFLQPRSSTFSISFSATSTTVHLSSVVTSTVPAGRYIRPIVLVDQKTPNYVRLSWKNDVDSGWTSETLPGVLNSSDQSGIWQTPTPSNSFRFRFAADGTTRVPFLQHYYAGVIGCEPVAIDEAGKPYCPYPEEMSIPAEREPYPATISFP